MNRDCVDRRVVDYDCGIKAVADRLGVDKQAVRQ
jgi:hypothetical protein